MRRTLWVGLFLFCFYLVSRQTRAGGKMAGQGWNKVEEYIWLMAEKSELRSFNADRSGATFVLDYGPFLKAVVPAKVIPARR